MASARAVILEVGGVQVGGVYGKCGVGSHEMGEWLRVLRSGVVGREWILLCDWNMHHSSWLLNGVETPTTAAHLFWVVHKSHGGKLLIA